MIEEKLAFVFEIINRRPLLASGIAQSFKFLFLGKNVYESRTSFEKRLIAVQCAGRHALLRPDLAAATRFSGKSGFALVRHTAKSQTLSGGVSHSFGG